MGTTVTIRDIDERIWREVKAEAARENITIGDAISKAITAWLAPKVAMKKKASPFDIKPFSGISGPGASDEDAAIYGYRAGEKPYDIPRRRAR